MRHFFVVVSISSNSVFRCHYTTLIGSVFFAVSHKVNHSFWLFFLSTSKPNCWQELFTMLSSSSRIAIASRSSLIRSSKASVQLQLQLQLQARQQHVKSANAADESQSQSQHRSNFVPVYVHHVSKIALQHLTANQSDWLVEKGLDRGLKLHPIGTFVLNFPARKGFDAGRIWCVGPITAAASC
jgi:hypothetical protein